MNRLTLLIVHTIPLFAGIAVSYYFWRSNFLLLLIYLAVLLSVIAAGKDAKTEFVISIYGAVLGVVVEVIGTSVSRYQSFAQPDAGGIPFWLIVAWSFGFVLMKRVALIIATGSPWVRQ